MLQQDWTLQGADAMNLPLCRHQDVVLQLSHPSSDTGLVMSTGVMLPAMSGRPKGLGRSGRLQGTVGREDAGW